MMSASSSHGEIFEIVDASPGRGARRRGVHRALETQGEAGRDVVQRLGLSGLRPGTPCSSSAPGTSAPRSLAQGVVVIAYVLDDGDLGQVVRVSIFLLALACNLWVGWRFLPVPDGCGRCLGRDGGPRRALWPILAFTTITFLIWFVVASVLRP